MGVTGIRPDFPEIRYRERYIKWRERISPLRSNVSAPADSEKEWKLPVVVWSWNVVVLKAVSVWHSDKSPAERATQVKTFESLRCRSEFDKVKQIGRRESSGLFTMLWIPEDGEFRRCGIICSRKFHVRAVKRNRARRLVRESLRLIGAENVQPCSLVIIPRRGILKVKMPVVKNALENAMKRAGILIDQTPDSSLDCASFWSDFTGVLYLPCFRLAAAFSRHVPCMPFLPCKSTVFSKAHCLRFGGSSGVIHFQKAAMIRFRQKALGVQWTQIRNYNYEIR